MDKREVKELRNEIVDRAIDLLYGEFTSSRVLEEATPGLEHNGVTANYHQVLKRITRAVANRTIIVVRQQGRTYIYTKAPMATSYLAKGSDLTPDEVCDWLREYMRNTIPVSNGDLADLRTKVALVEELQEQVSMLILQKDAIRKRFNDQKAAMRKEFDDFKELARVRIQRLGQQAKQQGGKP